MRKKSWTKSESGHTICCQSDVEHQIRNVQTRHFSGIWSLLVLDGASLSVWVCRLPVVWSQRSRICISVCFACGCESRRIVRDTVTVCCENGGAEPVITIKDRHLIHTLIDTLSFIWCLFIFLPRSRHDKCLCDGHCQGQSVQRGGAFGLYLAAAGGGRRTGRLLAGTAGGQLRGHRVERPCIRCTCPSVTSKVKKNSILFLKFLKFSIENISAYDLLADFFLDKIPRINQFALRGFEATLTKRTSKQKYLHQNSFHIT